MDKRITYGIAELDLQLNQKTVEWISTARLMFPPKGMKHQVVKVTGEFLHLLMDSLEAEVNRNESMAQLLKIATSDD